MLSNLISIRKNRKSTITMGVKLYMKSMNPSFAIEPISIFGGSPISVAVPPMLDANIIDNRSGRGFTRILRTISITNGVIRRTVVTLSMNAEIAAVIAYSTVMSLNGCLKNVRRIFIAI